MPLAPGHLLVTTRRHHEKISDVSEEEAAELGVWLGRLSRVLMRVTGVGDWNVVQNNVSSFLHVGGNSWVAMRGREGEGKGNGGNGIWVEGGEKADSK